MTLVRIASRFQSVLSIAVLMGLAMTVASGAFGAEPVALYVATDGKDAWSGSLAAPNAAGSDGPFATIERARDAIRQIKQARPLPQGGVTVELAAGVYELARSLELVQQDSGTEHTPIVYRARKGAEVRLVGGRVVTGWQPVTDAAVLARLDEAARGHVLQADLKAQGVADLGEMKPGPRWGQSEPGLELFFQDRPMTLARWPNEGFVKIVDVLGPTPVDVRGTKGCREGIFTYDGDRPKRWSGAQDVMLQGYWFWDWADQRLKVASIDTENRVITLQAQPQHAFGFRKGHWYYAYNLLTELDRPGEWYLDRQTGILYFWPPAPIENGKPMISVLPKLVTMKDVAYVTLRGMTLETCRGTAVTIAGGSQTRVVGCVIRNTGGWAVSLSGRESGVVGCDLYNLADGGVSLSGGDRRTLTPAGLYMDNCHLFQFGRWNPICKPGVNVDGVGNRVTHNLFHDAPHMAVMWGGNDHLFEFNEFHSVVQGANDAGIMYAGYNPAMRGHTIRYNYFHHVYGFEGRGCNGVYLDDMFCSATIFGNVFYQVPRAAFIGGGHDNVVENNIFVDCKPALHVDARMMGWASASVPIMKERLEAVPYQDEPWRSRYPQLLTYLEGNYAEPRNNLVARNLCWGGTWDEVEAKAKPGVKFVDNLTDQDPHFVDAERLNFQLREDSPAWKLGFQRIPIERIGLYASDDRASWPVRHQVRPKPAPSAQPAKGN
ncbi:MAG TPA: right-handed parallel beta-helix repeat-containing protein [Candidatus Anammoximicrobium sp.]|nr:right-handed parallel beta-helix repeat-containing protein [Candidatus Anammoximicrobium sp.]